MTIAARIANLPSSIVPEGAATPVLGLDVDKEEAKKAKAEAAKAEKDKAAKRTFSDQMRAAKANSDPLLDKILGKPAPAKEQDKPQDKRPR